MGKKVVMLVVLAMILVGCSSGPKAEFISANYIDFISASGGVSYHFEGMDNVEIRLNFRFDESLSANLDPGGDDYRSEIYLRLVEGAHFYYEGKEVERVYGYWPQKAGKNYADEMTLFYTVPTGHTSDSMRFVYDGDVLGDGGVGIDVVIKPGR